MSVLSRCREISKVAFVYNAWNIYMDTVGFLTRLSNRYSRILATDVLHNAHEVLSHANMANTYFPNSKDHIEKRRCHLEEARGYLDSLELDLSFCYTLMQRNPQGCFTSSNGKTLSSKEATRKLDKICTSLGNLIDDEKRLLAGTIKSLGDKEKKLEEKAAEEKAAEEKAVADAASDDK
jgi:hypothetical protein